MNNKPNNNIDKQNYLIKNIFLTSNYSVPINTIRINNDINGFNFNTINNIINKQILNKISSNKSLTLFNKTYTNDSFDKFMKKFNKLIYFCYRKNMHPINTRLNISITRDSGWGCMIRCGQMIMSRAIYKYLKAEKYTTEKAITETIKLFLDIPYDTKNIPNFFTYIMSKNPYINTQMAILSPFGLHMNCSLGKIYNKYAGEWFSDVNICQNYRDLNNYLNIIPNLKIFSFISQLEMAEVMEECFSLIDNNNKENNTTIDMNQIITFNNKKYVMKKSGLIFVSMRLGINKVGLEYYSSIINLFKCKECMGIIGGETNLAHYFIGYNDKGNLLYLDPHITRDAIFELNINNIMNDYLTKNLLQISMSDMSTALSVGFLFRNKNEFEDLTKFLDNYCKDEFACFGYSKEKIVIDINQYENLLNDEDDF